MKQSSSIHGLLTILNIYTISVLLVLKKSTASNPQYDACLPRNISCGQGPNISFPFYIQGRQGSYCGSPGFEVTCGRSGFPTIRREVEYVIEDIFYQNQSVRVYSSGMLDFNSSRSCVPILQNTTTNRSARFNFVDTENLYLFYNCSSDYSFQPVSLCNDSQMGVVFYENDDEDLIRNATQYCENNFFVPVDTRVLLDNRNRRNIEDVLHVLINGFEMNWVAGNCSVCEQSGGRCGSNDSLSDNRFQCFCPNSTYSRSCNEPGNRTLMIALTISGGVLILICMIICLLIWLRRKRIQAYFISRNKSFGTSSNSDIEGEDFHYGIPIFCYKELEKVTNNFDPSKELGDGGFGTVYYGKLGDGREVAIKRLYEHNYKRVQQFMNEIQILTTLKHPNLVTLYGCTSRKSRELILVYEYIANGTVADHLHGVRAKDAPLTWALRMSIAIETATALTYLHKSDIVHRDVKTNNILLDSNYCVKVADFGLSRLFPTDVTHVSTAPQGTPGYVDPEYHQCYQLTDKSDVYSFGVVLVELISSMPAVDITRHRHEINLANLAVNRIQKCALDELIDSSLGYKTDSEIMRMTTSVAELAFQCLQLDKDLRPSMDEVLDFLRDIQNGEEFKFDSREDSGHYNARGKIPPSPETEDVELLKKNRYYQSSPIAVTDVWCSATTTASSTE